MCARKINYTVVVGCEHGSANHYALVVASPQGVLCTKESIHINTNIYILYCALRSTHTVFLFIVHNVRKTNVFRTAITTLCIHDNDVVDESHCFMSALCSLSHANTNMQCAQNIEKKTPNNALSLSPFSVVEFFCGWINLNQHQHQHRHKPIIRYVLVYRNIYTIQGRLRLCSCSTYTCSRASMLVCCVH